jgi:hypothetical protein
MAANLGARHDALADSEACAAIIVSPPVGTTA